MLIFKLDVPGGIHHVIPWGKIFVSKFVCIDLFNLPWNRLFFVEFADTAQYFRSHSSGFVSCRCSGDRPEQCSPPKVLNMHSPHKDDAVNTNTQQRYEALFSAWDECMEDKIMWETLVLLWACEQSNLLQRFMIFKYLIKAIIFFFL